MQIYFKGQPSDCRVNVQNMNAAEGELDKLQEQSDDHDEYTYRENCENISNNKQNSSFSCRDMEDFKNAVIEADLDEDWTQDDQNRSQYFHEDCSNEPSQNFTQEIATAINTIESSRNDTNTDEDYFDLNSTDFTIKITSKSCIGSKKLNQASKISIFESNNDFDDSLDF